MTRVPFRSYVIATAVGILPAIAVYAYFADSLIAGATGAREQALLHVTIAGVVIILLSFGPATYRRILKRGGAGGDGEATGGPERPPEK